jgi:hypothetical protein
MVAGERMTKPLKFEFRCKWRGVGRILQEE